MEDNQLKLVETAIVLVILAVTLLLVKYTFRKLGSRYQFQQDRIQFTIKLFNISLYLSAFVSILFIWGVDQNELVLFLSSFLAILGIALFAQWSMLSNVTASIMLFISHPAKVGDTIIILDKDFPLSGKIKDIGAFFISIRTEHDELVTIPNSIIFQKMTKIVTQKMQ